MAEEPRAVPWASLRPILDSWDVTSRATDIWWRRRAGAAAIQSAAKARLAELVAFARAHSPFYRERYAHLPAAGVDVRELPVVNKRELMARFDDWVTDPAVTCADVRAFLADPARMGARYRGRYLVWKSSGTSGVPGIFVEDASALATYDALIAAQNDRFALAARLAWGFVAQRGRAALIAATGDHYASIVSWRRMFGSRPWLEARSFSLLEPLPHLVAALNAWRPAFVAGYPTVLAQLADEQSAGRLRIRPMLLWAGGETLTPKVHAAIERSFGCPLANEYGASECMSIAFGCRAGWLHLNADWVVLEPVDRDHRPVPPGTASNTVLLTNLANRVQPLIRYDLGDSVTFAPGRCPCGNALPALRVEGRRDDVVACAAPDGRIVRLLPLALTTVVEEAANVHRFQIVQDAPDRLTLRLDAGDDDRRRGAGDAACGALRGYLDRQSLPNVRVALGEGPPLPPGAGGKMRQVIAMICEDASAASERRSAHRAGRGTPRRRVTGGSRPSTR